MIQKVYKDIFAAPEETKLNFSEFLKAPSIQQSVFND